MVCVAEGLKSVGDEFHLWDAISMIIEDTKQKSGVVVRLQRMF